MPKLWSERLRRWHSPTAFSLIALCFVLPFATVTFVGGCESSGEAGDAHFTGIQLVTRSVPPATGADSKQYARFLARHVEDADSTAAEIAFAAVLVGLGLGLFGVAGGAGVCAAVGLGAVLQLSFTLGDGYDWQPHIGQWLALGGFAWVWLLHLFRWTQRRQIAGGRSLSFWVGVGAGIVALNVLMILAAISLRYLSLPLILAVFVAAVVLYIRRWVMRRRLGVANSAGYWELVVAGSVAIYLSLPLAVLLRGLWAVPLVWVGALGVIRLVKEANHRTQPG